MFQTLSSQAYS